MSKLKKYPKFVSSVYYRIRELLCPSKITDVYQIPVIINNFNRLESLKLLVERLEQAGCRNIHILDNDSTYAPLLEYYKTCRPQVHFLHRNLGFKALWKSDLRKRFCNDYYVYTDSDVVPAADCPNDFMRHFWDVLHKHPLARKAGFSLRIDNLPDCYEFKEQVIEKESPHYMRPVDDGTLYRAPIDTTFAMYRPRVGLSRSRFVEAYRTAAPYCAEHLPWYSDSANLTDEEKYYIQSVTQATSWTSKSKSSPTKP